MVERERALRERRRRERHEPDAVVRPLLDEIVGGLLGDVEPVERSEILGGHAG